MNNRERFQAAMNFEPTDKPCHIEYGFWPETYDRWKKEGLSYDVVMPKWDHISRPNDLFDYFDVIKFAYFRLELYYVPAFEREVLEEGAGYRIIRDERGVIVREKVGSVSLPQFMEYPIENRKDYMELRERLTSSRDKRLPENWDTMKSELCEQNHSLVCSHMDGPFGYLRELMGLENMLMMFYDDPDLIKMMINDRVDADMELYEQPIKDTMPDFAFLWEDMCYKNGPMMSPELFCEFMLPAYKKLTDYFNSLGIKYIMVDSDGDISEMIPHWIEGGVNCLTPFEVKCGMDVREIRKQYPELRILGGIDKHKLEGSRADIDTELHRILPEMLRSGGYCVTLDHWVHDGISLENFMYYVAKVKNFK